MIAEQLARGVDAVRELHKPDDAKFPWCFECQFKWPCRTIRTLDEALR